MRIRSSAELSLVALLSACSGTECGITTVLKAGEPCGRLFTYCPSPMVCCLTAAGGQTLVCSSECRPAKRGEPCNDYPSEVMPQSNKCLRGMDCVGSRCVCVPWCSYTQICMEDEDSCKYTCCGSWGHCVAGKCVARQSDFGPDRWRSAPDGRPDAGLDSAPDRRRDRPATEARGP